MLRLLCFALLSLNYAHQYDGLVVTSPYFAFLYSFVLAWFVIPDYAARKAIW